MDSNFFDRILQLAKNQGYKNITDFSKNGLGYSSPEKLNRLKDSDKKPSIEIIIDISNKFEFINLKWLITGRGKMDNRNDPDVINEPSIKYSKESDQRVIELQAEIISLMKEVSELKSRLPVTDQPIVSKHRAKNAG